MTRCKVIIVTIFMFLCTALPSAFADTTTIVIGPSWPYTAGKIDYTYQTGNWLHGKPSNLKTEQMIKDANAGQDILLSHYAVISGTSGLDGSVPVALIVTSNYAFDIEAIGYTDNGSEYEALRILSTSPIYSVRFIDATNPANYVTFGDRTAPFEYGNISFNKGTTFQLQPDGDDPSPGTGGYPWNPDDNGIPPDMDGPTMPQPPDNSWDLLGWVKYLFEWLIYIVDSAIWVLQKMGNTIAGVFTASDGFIKTLSTFFNFLPNEVIAVMVVGMAAAVLLRIFGR